MFLEIFHNFGNTRIWIQFVVRRNPAEKKDERELDTIGEWFVRLKLHKEASVRIESRFYQFRQKLPENAATIDSHLLQSNVVDHLNAKTGPNVRFIFCTQLVVGIFIDMRPPYGYVNSWSLKKCLLVTLSSEKNIQ